MNSSKLKSLVNDEINNNAKHSLEELAPIKEKLLQAWKDVPEEYKGEFLVVLLWHTRDWRKWDEWDLISSEQVVDWLRGSFQRAKSAYSEINIPKEFENH